MDGYQISTIVLGALLGIIMIINIMLIIMDRKTYVAVKHAYNNDEHCKYDKTNSPNCAGPTCSDAHCHPPYQTMDKNPAIKQIDTVLGGVKGWDDVDKIAPYSANLVSALERPQQLYVDGWDHQDTFNSVLYGVPNLPLGKVFYDNSGDGHIFIALRGTARGGDEWSEDSKYKQVQSTLFVGMGKIHNGFSEILYDIINPITDIINNIPYPIKTIVVTGHSLGASLSILIAVYLRIYHRNTKILCLPFACPRVGDPQFANAVDSMLNDNFQIYRFRNKDDLVPDTPWPVAPNFHNSEPYIYKHVGKEFYYSDNWGSIIWNHRLNNYIQAMYPPAKYQLWC